MAELIVVIAIVAVLMAMILPIFSSDEAEKQAAETYASDFYASLQYNMTRYQKTEYHLTPELQVLAEKYEKGEAGAEPYIIFRKDLGGNVFTTKTENACKYLYIEVAYEKGIKYVKIASTLGELIGDTTTTTSDAPFEKLLQNDLEEVMNSSVEGHYYAVVMCDYKYDDKGSVTAGYGDLKVMSAHYCEEVIPSTADKDDLMFVDFSELQCGLLCGTCSSDMDGTSHMGAPKTYLLNISDLHVNAIK